MATKKRKKSGPKEQRLKIAVPWEQAVGSALKVTRPAEGWPDEAKPKKRTKQEPA